MVSKRRPKKYFLRGLVLSLATLAAVLPIVNRPHSIQAAAGTRLYLSPSSQTVTAGSNLVITITIDPGGASVNTIQSVLTYSSANFNLVSVSPGTAFGSFPNTSTPGSLQFSAASQSPVITVQTVATVTFQATGTGTSAINLAGVCPPGDYSVTCSAAYDSVNSNNDLASVGNGSYTVAAPVSPVPPTPPSSPASTPAAPKASSHGSAASGSATSPTTSAPSISAAPTDSSSPVVAPTPTTNLTITILVTDSKHKPIKDAKVISGHEVKTTDSSGKATFHNVLPGRQVVVVKTGGSTKNHVITVRDDSASTVQIQTFSLTAARSASVPRSIAGVMVLVAAGLAILIAIGLTPHLVNLVYRFESASASGLSNIPPGPAPPYIPLTDNTPASKGFLSKRSPPLKPGTMVKPNRSTHP